MATGMTAITVTAPTAARTTAAEGITAATTGLVTTWAIVMALRWRGTTCRNAMATTPARAGRSMTATADTNASTATKTSTRPSTHKDTGQATTQPSGGAEGINGLVLRFGS